LRLAGFFTEHAAIKNYRIGIQESEASIIKYIGSISGSAYLQKTSKFLEVYLSAILHSGY
jgi:hypothetical protein